MSLRQPRSSWVGRVVGGALVAVTAGLLACSPTGGPQSASQTNWLRSCETREACGELQCICGICTLPCEDDAVCGGPSGTSCVPASDPGSIALCDGSSPQGALCLLRCDEDACPSDTSCSAGLCAPSTPSDAIISIDLTTRHQSLLGFGASLAFSEDELVEHPEKETLFDSMFDGLGLEVVRLRNRYEAGLEDELGAPAEILSAAADRLGRVPLVLMYAASPPAALKANDSRECSGDADVCTLVRLENGEFDYEGFANYWRISLDAYAAAGISPDYLSIQNNPDWVPTSPGTNEACLFLPQEGTQTVSIEGVDQTVRYPGYQEALSAVGSAIESLPDAPALVGPDASKVAAVSEYSAGLDSGALAAMTFHFYETDATQPDLEALAALRVLAEANGLPVFQTEMWAEGLDTAVLIHYATTVANASMYLQNDFVNSAWAVDPNPRALLQLSAGGFELQAPYHAMRHFAYRTGRGWRRVEAASDNDAILASAWLSPSEDALTIVLINPSQESRELELDVTDWRDGFQSTEVTRTVFDGVEASAPLGELRDDHSVRLPAGCVVTIAFWS